MRILSLVAFLFTVSHASQAQNLPESEKDTVASNQIKQNIFRMTANQPVLPDYETNFILAAHLERKINRSFSLLTKLGLAATWDRFGPDNDPSGTPAIYTVI